MIHFTCPRCNAEYQYPDDMAGNKIRCAGPNCNQKLLVPPPAAVAAPTAPVAPGLPEWVNDHMAAPVAPIVPAAPSGRLWNYLENGQAKGPVAASELRHLVADGRLKPKDAVWSAGMSEWRPMHEALPEMFRKPAVVAPRAPEVAPVRVVHPVAPIHKVAPAPPPLAIHTAAPPVGTPTAPTARRAPHAGLAAESVEVVPIDKRPSVTLSDRPEPPRRTGPTGRNEPRFTSEPTATPRRLPTNHAAVVTAVIAGLAAIGWLTSLLGIVGLLLDTSPVAWLTMIFLGSLFGGMVGSSLTGVARFRHSLYAGLWLAGLLFAVVVPLCLLFEWYAAQVTGAKDAAVEALNHGLGVVALCLILTPVLIVTGFLLGGGLDVAATTVLRGLRPRECWTYHTHDDKSFPVYGPWRNPVLAAFWSACGWALLLTCWIPLVVAGNLLGLLAAFALGQVCRRVARKYSAVSAKDALEKDPRPPIVYLRSFQDDGIFNPGTFFLANDWLRTLGEKTAEDNLSGMLAPFGPVVAIGRPEEEMPEVGAARIYVGDDHWQDLIKDLLSDRGALAVFQAGGTKGLRWELESVAAMLRPEQILMFLPFGLHWSPRRRAAGYAAFHAWAGPCFPAPLPDALDSDEFFCYFTSRPAWQTRILRPGIRPPERHPLAEVLADLQKGKRLRRWTLYNLKRLGLLMLAGVLLMPVSYGVQGLRLWLKGSPPAPVAAVPVVAPTVPEPPREALPIRYEGKALPYHITLAAAWKPTEAKPKQDLAFSRGEELALRVLVLDGGRDLNDAGKEYAENTRKATTPAGAPKFSKVTSLEDRKVQVRGKEWRDFKVELVLGDTKVWQRVRCYSDQEGTFYLVANLAENTPALDGELTQVFDSFELPPSP